MDLTYRLGRGIPYGLYLQLLTGISISYAALRRWWKADIPFFRHKELLADRFAYEFDPEVDLAHTWNPGRLRQSHPSADERLAFLREGRTETAYVTFLTVQELLLCFVYFFNPRVFDKTMGVWPRVLDAPCSVLAIAGSLIFAVEACRYPIPKPSRKRLAIWTGVLLLLGMAVASESDASTWFFLTQITVTTLVALRVATRTSAPSSKAADALSDDSLPVAQPPSVENRSARFHRALDRLGKGFSWGALVWGIVMVFQTLFAFAVVYVFGGALPSGLTMHMTVAPMLYALVQGGTVVAVTLRNLKRPHALTIAGEWVAHALAMFFVVDESFWLWDRWGVQPWSQTKIDLFRLPWGSPEAMRTAADVATDYPRAFRVTLFPQLALAAFYAHRIYRVVLHRRKEKENAESRT
ncbi:MAG: hypothetical protein M3P06_05360 [Acidobacteriota bacterium]|nr:hypothetical protein [Acidobacteriota bacterium]